MSHADFDVIIERDRNHVINNLLNNEIPAYFKRRHPRANTKTATYEFFGYMAGDYIIQLENKIQGIVMNHGVYHDRAKCFGKDALKKIAKRLGLDKKMEFKETLINEDFSTKVFPRNAFINGKTLNVENMPYHLKQKLFSYFSNKHSMSANSKDLVSRLNKSKQLDKLKQCYAFLDANM